MSRRPQTIGNNYLTPGSSAAAPGPLTGGTTIPGNGSSGIISVDYSGANFQMTVDVRFSTGAVMTVTFQYTTDDILGLDYQYTGQPVPLQGGGPALAETSINWYSHPNLTGVSTNTISNIAFPVTACRLICTAWTSGSAWARLLSTPGR